MPKDSHTEKSGDDSKNDDTALEEEACVDLEAQGIIIYDRATGAESHTMWMVRPSIQREITIDLPDILVESLGDGAEPCFTSHPPR